MAQETRATLSGMVADACGSVISGVAMSLTNTATGVTLTTATNEAGLYRFLFLNPGKYKLIATLSGFKTFERVVSRGPAVAQNNVPRSLQFAFRLRF